MGERRGACACACLCAWLALAWLAPGAAAEPGAPSPEEDRCVVADGDEMEYECREGQYTVRGALYRFVDVSCAENTTALRCATFPRRAFSKNGTLDSLSLTRCRYEEPLACLLGRLGAAAVRKVTLRDLPVALAEHHVRGLEGLTALRLYDKGALRAVPYGAVSALPGLREFRLHGSRVALLPGRFQAPLLTFLELSSDGIAELPPGAFEGLPALRYLGLWHNDLTELSPEAFRGIENLTQLNLAENGLRSLGSRALAPLRQLTQLTLTGNPLLRLPGDAFRDMRQLENITISSTEALTLGPATFSELGSLRGLVLQVCGLRELPAALLRGTPLRRLSLQQNLLQELPADVFQGQAELVQLDLSRNRLRLLSDDVFLPLAKLTELDLSYNRIESFSSHLFSALTRLETLRAANNGLRHIAETAFQGVPLRTLVLAHNRLSFAVEDAAPQYRLDACPFNGLWALRALDLRDNRVDVVCDYWRIMMTQLRRLDLSHNNFTELTTADLAYTSSDVTVDFSHNSIGSVLLEPALWEQLGSTATILLEHNPFQCDCYMYSFLRAAADDRHKGRFVVSDARCAAPPALAGAPLPEVPLDRLACSEPDCAPTCECVSRPSRGLLEARCDALGAPSRLTDDTEPVALKLSHAPTSLRQLPFENVVEIDLSGLNLTEVPYDGLPETVRLLNLSDNRLQRLPDALLDRDVSLALAANPLACDCWSQEHVARLLRNASRLADLARASCADGTALALVDPRRLCDVWLATSIGVSLAALGVLCAALAAVASRYWFELKLYVAKYLPWLLPEEKYDASKKYDVFVSYAHQDEEFVRDRLLARLEGPPLRLRACVHHRDWLLGETIPYNIAKSVAESRRTVIVLSEHFLGSVWGLMEFRAAHVQAASEGRARVVVLLLQDVRELKELDRELRAYLHTNTYVRWGEPWFWEKLADALPKRGAAVDRAEERRLQAAADKLVHRGLDVALNEEGKLVNAAFVKDV